MPRSLLPSRIARSRSRLSYPLLKATVFIDPAALSSPRRIAQELASTVEQALGVVATFRGFGGLAKVGTMFSLQGVVTTSKAGSFWLEFQCSEDRNPEAIWRVEFEDWIPTAQGRDD